MREQLLTQFPWFKDLHPSQLDQVELCASRQTFEEGQIIFREGVDATHCYLITHGRVAIEIYAAGRGTITIQTLGEGELLGWSWLIPPFKWRFDARATELTRMVVLDGVRVRELCETDPSLGYHLIYHFAQIIAQRLQATRMQLLDIYGEHE